MKTKQQQRLEREFRLAFYAERLRAITNPSDELILSLVAECDAAVETMHVLKNACEAARENLSPGDGAYDILHSAITRAEHEMFPKEPVNG